MVGFGFGGCGDVFRPRFGSGLSGRSDGFGTGLVLGPEALALLDGGEVQIAVAVTEAEGAIETMLEDDAILGSDPVGFLCGDLG